MSFPVAFILAILTSTILVAVFHVFLIAIFQIAFVLRPNAIRTATFEKIHKLLTDDSYCWKLGQTGHTINCQGFELWISNGIVFVYLREPTEVVFSPWQRYRLWKAARKWIEAGKAAKLGIKV